VTAKRKKVPAVSGDEKDFLTVAKITRLMARFDASSNDYFSIALCVNLTTSLGVKHILATIFA
jgi:hypothetical protein